VGLITWNLAPGVLDGVLARQPRAVWLSFGDPTPHLPPVHDAGAIAVCQVATVAEAQVALDAGADVVVAQGTEAGGHGRGVHPLEELVSTIRTSLPQATLVAAGGISDLAGYDAAITAGADGVALGSRFYATTEALDSPAAKDRLVAATGTDTVRSTVYDHIRGPVWPSGYTGRTLRTPWTDAWAGNEDDLAGELDALRAQHQQATEADDLEHRVVFAGQGVGAITTIESASTIVKSFPRIGEPATGGTS
jgi:nitronate monooxygenase